MNFGSRGVTAAAPRGDFGGLHALERLGGQSELGAVARWAVGIGAPYGGICVSLANALVLIYCLNQAIAHRTYTHTARQTDM